MSEEVNEFLAPPSMDKEDLQAVLTEIVNFVRSQRQFPNLKDVIPGSLTNAFSLLSERLNIPEIVFVSMLLPIASSLLPIGITIEIDPSTHFCPPAILWVGIVAESGATKSPPLRILLSPLECLQSVADQAYKSELEQYKEHLKLWEEMDKKTRSEKPTPPERREYYLQDTTIEAIADILSKQPERGIIQAVDELAGWFNGLNQYRRGQGSDRQKWLSIYNGGAIKVNRKTSETLHVSRTAVSLLGTIQPSTLRRQIDNLEDVDGLWSRFWWVALPVTEMPPPGQGVRCNITELLTAVYQRLERFRPTTCRLSEGGKANWKNWHLWCEKQKTQESQAALRAIYPKAKERAARIALVLHCLNAAINDHPPAEIISNSILSAAIELTRWGVEQSLLLYADMGAAEHEDSAKVARFILHFAGQEVTARMTARWYSAKRQIKAEVAREFMRFVESLGLATGNGRTGSKYKIKVDYPIVPGKSPEIPCSRDFKSHDIFPDTNMTTPDIVEGNHEPLQINVMSGQETVRDIVRTPNPLIDKDFSNFVSNNSKGAHYQDFEPESSTQSPSPSDSVVSAALLRIKIGDRVGKKNKLGWGGTVTQTYENRALVHWDEDDYAVWVPIAELKVR